MSAGETVGRQFRAWDGALYLCTRYIRREGFWMRVVAASPTLCRRKVGEETCVSERAIGRTFHRETEDQDASQAVHETPCECEQCEEQTLRTAGVEPAEQED